MRVFPLAEREAGVQKHLLPEGTGDAAQGRTFGAAHCVAGGAVCPEAAAGAVRLYPVILKRVGERFSSFFSSILVLLLSCAIIGRYCRAWVRIPR